MPAQVQGCWRGRVVVDAVGVENADRPVMEGDEAHGQEVDEPVLVEGDHPEHHEEVEVHLDHSAGEMDQDAGCAQQPQRDSAGPDRPAHPAH